MSSFDDHPDTMECVEIIAHEQQNDEAASEMPPFWMEGDILVFI